MTSKMYDRCRDVALFLAALSGVYHETVVAKAERPYLLALFASMLGLPVIQQILGRDK
jgi:hypothetical protein